MGLCVRHSYMTEMFWFDFCENRKRARAGLMRADSSAGDPMSCCTVCAATGGVSQKHPVAYFR